MGVDMEGLLAADGFGGSVALAGRVVNILGFGDFISGFRVFVARGGGVRARGGLGGFWEAVDGLIVALVIDLRMAGLRPFLGFTCCSCCSNIPIKELVGGIDDVSKGCSKLPLGLTLLMDPVDRRVKLDCLCKAAGDS